MDALWVVALKDIIIQRSVMMDKHNWYSDLVDFILNM